MDYANINLVKMETAFPKLSLPLWFQVSNDQKRLHEIWKAKLKQCPLFYEGLYVQLWWQIQSSALAILCSVFSLPSQLLIQLTLSHPRAWLWSYRGVWHTEEPLLERPSHEPLRKMYLPYFFSIILQCFMVSRVSPSSRIFSVWLSCDFRFHTFTFIALPTFV